MYSEEIFIKLTEDHVKRCYRALILTDKMIELYKKRPIIFPEEFYDIIEEYLMKSCAEDEREDKE